jgi:hypothetical protein
MFATIRFKRSKEDPLLLYKWSEIQEISLWIIYIEALAGAGRKMLYCNPRKELLKFLNAISLLICMLDANFGITQTVDGWS